MVTRSSTLKRWRRSVRFCPTPEDNLWTFVLPDGRGMRKATEFHGALHSQQEKLAAEAGCDV